MHIEAYRNYCLEKPNTTESFPFDDKTLVLKVAEKIFTLATIEPFERINVKCNPTKAITLRKNYNSIQPGYHMNKKHWNTILLNGELSDKQIYKYIDHSYNLIIASLSKRTHRLLAKNKPINTFINL